MTSRAVLACLVALASCWRGDEPRPIVAHAATLTLDAGDRAALKGAVAVGDEVVALTSSGNLVRYDRELRAIRDARMHPAVVAIASAGEKLYGALADGQVGAIDRTTLAFAAIARASAEPGWLGVHGDELVVVSARGVERISLAGEHRGVLDVPPSRKPSRGRTTWVLDGDELWLGIDSGEWGGDLLRLSLASGAATWFAEIPSGVYGISRSSRGTILIHGGTIHMGLTHGYLLEIAGDAATLLWHVYSIPRRLRKTVPPQVPPPLPVIAVLPRARPLVLVWNRLYEASGDFKQWNELAAIRAREDRGRPDAMGNYPAIVSVIDRGDAVIFATAHDGLWIYRDGKLERAS